jgi:hypothetical protein
MIRRLVLLWANLKYWWETRHERAAYRRMFRDRAVRTHTPERRGRAGPPVFKIQWLRSGGHVAEELSILRTEAEVIAHARSRARYVAERHPGREPDSFRLTDATGKSLGVFRLTDDRPPNRTRSRR